MWKCGLRSRIDVHERHLARLTRRVVAISSPLPSPLYSSKGSEPVSDASWDLPKIAIWRVFSGNRESFKGGIDVALFRDRADAGRRLARHLMNYSGNPNAIVLALPRGGVPVAYEIAAALRLPMDVYIVRKLGMPGHEELALGAVASDGSYVIDESLLRLAGVTGEEFEATLRREITELKRRQVEYRDDRPEPQLLAKTIIIVDDGLATGASMYSAISALRQRDPARIVVAVPVAPRRTVHFLEDYADSVISAFAPDDFGSVGSYYDDFAQVSDAEVRACLERAERESKQWNVA